ncbi:MAG: prolyl oligopeptidase family serine peptidase [Deltaproteobacteria bacterium]|nr:prolyl oligopeptidase family serine peptidase [Deltaproteobacteria bacterium]
MKQTLLIVIALALIVPTMAQAQTDIRAWNVDGQTWILWRDAAPTPFTYDVYRSSAPITDPSQAELAGRLFPEDWQASRLKFSKLTATWRVPTEGGGRYTLGADEGVFVYTPHEAVPEYFAVVKHDETALGPDNAIGPVTQALDPVQCHPQLESVNEAGNPFTVYAHWIDGRADFESGRADYPVMGNEYANGTAYVFALHEPADGRTGGRLPLVFAMHGGGPTSNYANFGDGYHTLLQLDTTIHDGFLASVDDSVSVLKWINFTTKDVLPETTRWFGYWTGFNRFETPDGDPPDDAVVVNYTIRRVDFIREWLIANEDVDPDRVALFGVSGGGSGVNSLVRWSPEAYSAGIALVPIFSATINPFAPFMEGTYEQNLATNLPGGIGLRDWYWPTTLLHDEDLPFTKYGVGKRDTFEDWSYKVNAFDEMEEARWGAYVYWDERDHVIQWAGAHWTSSPALDPTALTRYRRDQSYPAFSFDDQNPLTPEREPDIGNGDRSTGTEWGTWGGYFDWNGDTIDDTPDFWAATLFLVSESDFENDVAPFEFAYTDVSVRRAREFHPEPSATLAWRLVDLGSGEELDAGETAVGSSGLVTVPGIGMTKEPRRLEVEVVDEGGADDDDTGDDDDSGDPGDAGDDDDDDGGGCCGC